MKEAGFVDIRIQPLTGDQSMIVAMTSCGGILVSLSPSGGNRAGELQFIDIRSLSFPGGAGKLLGDLFEPEMDCDLCLIGGNEIGPDADPGLRAEAEQVSDEEQGEVVGLEPLDLPGIGRVRLDRRAADMAQFRAGPLTGQLKRARDRSHCLGQPNKGAAVPFEAGGRVRVGAP
ncbi:hypothetical protein MTX26_36050 (plasmid) [Bradyrhizobium sp. ISRA443]|uniref:hypothetical protein n=1 Tax=unclassified Bradyrhizobium TaxID=2631580 RepID=UPI00247A1809|nr:MULTISPECIES: hypothetical protein [unclassified Bradyrhizobium]WGR90834.1 hypothetical protein MTX20_00480 [Bradyrhizobium sp. ISRA435]WGS03034.1 hypothetical protein MTX23_36000 [Bradyrhizobium sp. ISRA436]WGS09931.1 hypothetical protein MTX18_36045 [Bradyrhizobium sp. ISRA437]WGS16816.1 hypothetical protein MTX26_36050 [Bradyrhizobium sp. ISRA443]